MRRTFIAALVTAALALAFAGVAAAANGGFTPVTPHSPNASRINDAYLWIAIFTGAIFVIVEGALLVFILRFRRGKRSREAEGPQIRGHARLEIVWTVIPVVILVAIGGFVFYKLPGITDVPRATAGNPNLNVKVEGRQFFWQFTYPNGAISINRLRAPEGQVVDLQVVSRDVNHSWWIPALGGKFDAIPGRTNHTWFKADQNGVFDGTCAELCGIQHAAMRAEVEVMPRAAYDAFVTRRAGASAATELGAEEATGVCAACHYFKQGAGTLVGPNLAGNPLLTDERGLSLLVRNGQGQMPAVGKYWTDAQIKALVSYFKGRAGGG